MEPEPPGMGIVDYLVVLSLLAASLLIGLYYSCCKRQKSTADYFVGGRSMPVLPSAISLLASYVSAILILGVPSEFFYQGSLLWEAMYGYFITFPLAAYIFIPTFYRLQLTSVYEYLELRFESRLVRLLASLTFAALAVLYLGVAVYAPSIALHTISGFPQWASIICIGGVGTLYTAMGGLRAVVWTDVLQCILMFGGLLAIIIKGSIQVGGLGEAFRISNERGRLQFFDFNLDPFVRHTTLACILGQGVGALATYGCQQTAVQRYCSMGSLKQAIWSLLLNVPLLIGIVSLGWVAGTVIFAVYADCDPLLAGYINKTDAIVPYYVLHNFSALPGMLGLFIASLLSGALSSVSSLLNALAAVAWEDVASKIDCLKKRGDAAKLAITKFMGFGFGLITIGLAFVVGNLKGLIQTTFALNYAVGGPLLGVFLLALFHPRCNKYGAIVGMLCGHALSVYITIGALSRGPEPLVLYRTTVGCEANATTWFSSPNETRALMPDQDPYLYNLTSSYSWKATEQNEDELEWPQKLFKLSYLYYCLVGCVVTIVVGTIVSLITAPWSPTHVPRELLHPLVAKFAPNSKCAYDVSSFRTDKIRAQTSNTDQLPGGDIVMAQEDGRKVITDNNCNYQYPRYRPTGDADNFTSAL